MTTPLAGIRPATVAVLVKTFPKLSETFILGELLGLERQGIALRVFSLQRPTDTVLPGAHAELYAPVSYVPPLRFGSLATLLRAHLRLLGRRPLAYLQALRFALRRPEPGRWGDFCQAGWLAGRLGEAGIDHLYVHFINRPAGVAELVGRLSGIRYSVSAHAKDIYLSSPELLRRKIAGARFVVTCSEYNRRHLAALNVASTPVVRLYHGVDLARFRPAVHATPVRDVPPLILSVGRLREKKGFATLIRACDVLRRTGTAFRCQIVGYGPEQTPLEDLIAELGLAGYVELAGALAPERVIERYRRASLFALPCQVGNDGDRDGIPNVLLEAMAMQLPVIATPVSGIPELIQASHNGLLVTPRQPAELAEAIRRVLADPAFGARLGRAARATVAARFDNTCNLRRLAELLRAAQTEATPDTKRRPAALSGRLYG